MARQYDPFSPTRRVAQEARRYANQLIAPLIAAANAEASRRGKSGQSSIASYSDQLARQLMGMEGQTAQNYREAEQSQGAVDTALADRLSSQGSALTQALKAQLDQIHAPASQIAQVAGGAGQTAQGAANAGFARGSASRSQLISQGAAARQYSAAQPGIARLGGLNAAQQFGAQIESGRQSEVAGLRAKIPGLAADRATQIDAANLQKAIAQLGFVGDQSKLAADMSQFQQSQATTQRGQDITARGQDLTNQRAVDSAANTKKKARSDAFWTNRNAAITQAHTFYTGKKTKGKGGKKSLFGDTTTTTTTKRVGYRDAYRQLYAQYGVPLVRRYGYTPARIDQMIRAVMQSVGYKNPDAHPTHGHTKRNWPH